MESHTTSVQVIRRRYAWQAERQIITALLSGVLYIIFRLSFADTSAGAFLCAFPDHEFSTFAGGVRGSSYGPVLIIRRAWDLRRRVLPLVDVCWYPIRWACYQGLGCSGKSGT